MIDSAAWKRPTAHPFPLPAALELALRHYYAGFVWVLCEWLESPSPKSVDAFLADAVAALPAPLRTTLLPPGDSAVPEPSRVL